MHHRQPPVWILLLLELVHEFVPPGSLAAVRICVDTW